MQRSELPVIGHDLKTIQEALASAALYITNMEQKCSFFPSLEDTVESIEGVCADLDILQRILFEQMIRPETDTEVSFDTLDDLLDFLCSDDSETDEPPRKITIELVRS